MGTEPPPVQGRSPALTHRHRGWRWLALATAALAIYAAAAWLFLLPPLEFPPARPLAEFPPTACSDPAQLRAILAHGEVLYVPLGDIPAPLVESLRRQEDGFLHHRGVDWEQVRRALEKNVAAGAYRYGASTITMQLMRELYLGKERTVLRKLRESAYALQAERRLSKPEILEWYLNLVHWGPDIRGVGAASCYYFGRPPAALDADAARRLVAVLPSPSRFGPALRDWAHTQHGAGRQAASSDE